MSLIDLEEVEQEKFEVEFPPDLPLSLPSRLSVGNRPISIRRRTRLIIAIDFGTTYSGASFALLHPTDAPENAKVSVVRNWKGELPGNTTSNKVPTLIAYDDDGKPHWGFDIPSELDDATVKWVKLALEPEIHARGTFNDTGIIDPDISKRTLERLRHGAIEAASDYVRLLWEHVQAQIINEHSQATYNFAEKSVVFSVPAVWSETARHNTYLVAAGAGLASPDLNLQTISEPEAAAMAVLKERAPFLKLDDCYLVVDAGGGTVDLTSYVLKSISPLRLEEIIAGDGDVCGAVLLELNFLKLLRTYLTAEVLDALPPENLNRIINDFETGVRKAFDGEDRTNYTVAMPGVPEKSCAKIKAGLLRLTAAELKPVFRPVIEKVERLVRKQIQQLRAQNRTLTAILLVERENSSLAAQISDLQKQNTRLDAGKTKSERDLVLLQGRFDRLEHEHSQLKSQKAVWAREKKTLSGNISKIENEKMKLESSNEVLEADKERLQSGLREIELENADMRKRIKKIDNEKEKLKDGKATLEEQITALNLHQTRLGNMIASLKEDNRTLNAQLNTFRDEEKIMRADKNFLQSKLAEFNSAKNKWVNTNNELSRMVGDLQRENAQKEEDNMHLIDQCSGLVQEISGLRLQHSIDDDSALQEKFHSLHFAIRSWCCQIHDAKPPEKSAVFRQFPLGAPGSVCQLSYLADHEVNVLIACTWEWMIKLIFGSNNAETGYHDSPDLWLEEDMALCLHNLELRLQIQDPKAAVEWRSLTVRQLTMEGHSYQEARVANIAAKILRWIGACLHLDVSADSMAQIRHNLKAEVVTKAIEFSLFLRRQYSIVSPHIPQDLDRLSTYHLSLRTSQRRAEPKMCVRPQLRRLSLASNQGQLSYDIIVEAELSRVPSLEENQAQAPLPMEQDEID